MHVMILGAGVVGVTAAWQLLEDGHQVTVLDRRDGPAMETSFANAGLIATGHALAWASPRALRTLVGSLASRDASLRLHPSVARDPAFWRWALAFVGQCTSERALANTRLKHRLCRYSQQALQAVVEDTGIDYHGERKGLLYLHRTQETLERGAANMAILGAAGQALEVIDRERVVTIDPALAPAKDKIAGAIFAPTDESGDAHLFTRALAARCADRGARFVHGITIRRLDAIGDRITRAVTDRGEERADVFLLALGSYSPLVTEGLSERPPVYPVKGYSVTIPVDGANAPPTVGGIDEDNLTAYVRLGDRVRATSVAELRGYDTSHRAADFAPMLRSMQELLPNAGDWRKPSYWACLRPMTPRGLPILGRGRYRNLYYDTGHGHMGWTMACGTAQITADLIAGRSPDLPLEGMTLS